MKTKVIKQMIITFIFLVTCLMPSILFAQGSWTAPIGSGGVEAIHMTMLHTDRVFVYSFRDGCCTSTFPWRAFNPANPTSDGTTGNTGPTNNYFCAGHVVLADGTFLDG